MTNNFITNNPQKTKTMESRLQQLISVSKELKFLVGFFYFSGWKQLHDSLKKRIEENDDFKIKLLIGLEVDKTLKGIFELSEDNSGLSNEEILNNYFRSLGAAINNEDLDIEQFYNQVEFFINLIEHDKLIIRKTHKSNHSKLYIFNLSGEAATIIPSEFITGSSNLTKAGLKNQSEFNVEIRDYGTEEAEKYFDDLWNSAIKITEIPERKRYIIDFIKNRSQAATVTPFEAYVFILRIYLEIMELKQIKPRIEKLLEKNGFKKLTYQIDAVNQALSIIENYNGVIIADVVGLGKSVIASLLAKNIGKRGLVICPPALIGERINKFGEASGWWEYLQRFELHDWKVESSGKLEQLAEYFTNSQDAPEVIIVDEAHRFRNQDTADYEALQNICRNKTVILLTATPFNNSPADIFSLLKLFIIPGKSGITLDDDLEGRFSSYQYMFYRLSFITKNYKSENNDKRIKAENYYKLIIGLESPVDPKIVKNRTKELAKEIKSVLEPVLIRRNRLDLKNDFIYSKEATELSEVKDPVELFYELTPEQSEFYDKVLYKYFGSDGEFTGAIYQPFLYEQKILDEDKLGLEENRAYQQQRNLYDFMRRLLVKRFESSFGAFQSSIERFEKVNKIVLSFIQKTNKYILDRKLIEEIYENDSDKIDEALEEFAKSLEEKNLPKHDKVYNISTFKRKDEFINNIKSDIKLFDGIKEEINKLSLFKTDPKREKALDEIGNIINSNGQTKRKVVVFTEYLDTLKALKPYFKNRFGSKVLFSEGNLGVNFSHKLNADFNAQYKGEQKDEFDILFTSDKLSEGVNLNRAGAVINYDIPWNPTRVIQRVGRINRIGVKVFDELYIYNFFPSVKGADIVKSREIAANKMFLIHNALGEDAKIFAADEEPTPSEMFKRINENPENEEELNTITVLRNRFNKVKEEHPQIVERVKNLPVRIKTAKEFDKNEILVLRKKGLSLFIQKNGDPANVKSDISLITFDELLHSVECLPEEQKLDLSPNFWKQYERMKIFKPAYKAPKTAQSIEQKAFNNLNTAVKRYRNELEPVMPFVLTLLNDLRHFQTLTKYTLRRIAKYGLDDNGAKNLENFIKEIKWVKAHLGENYLDEIKMRVEKNKTEVIVAVENIITNI